MSAAVDTKDGDHRARVVATVTIALAAMAIWAPTLGAGVLWGLPMVALAAFIVAHGSATRSPRVQWVIIAAWPVWIILGLLFAGLPPSVLMPGSLGATKDAFGEALSGFASGGRDPWTLAVWLVISGGAWFFGAVQSARPARISVAMAFFILALPFAAALLLRRADDAPWHGAVVLAAGLLWAARSELRASLPAVGAVALLAIVISAAIGPSERKIDLTPSRPDFTRLDTRLTFGPQTDDKTGATMFEIRSPEPALWRMQALDYFDGRTWVLNPSQGDEPLPQPGAAATTSTVTVRALRDRMIVAPGRVLSATTPPNQMARAIAGESAEFGVAPGDGATYAVRSEVVPPSAQGIATVPVPRGNRFARYQQVFPSLPGGERQSLEQTVAGFTPEVRASPWGRVYGIANDLSRGARTQLEVVQNVQEFLVGGGRFRYSLDVPRPGPDPLVDFLVSSRTGYCQHFAGAAALLLRLANVPTRVAVGFATGQSAGKGRWEVRDVDAHAWIEVYFAGTGWVPFNPTAAGGEALVSPDAAMATPSTPAGSGDRTAPLIGLLALLVLLAVGAAVALWRRRGEPRPLTPLGDVLVRLVPAPAGPARTFSELLPDLEALGPRLAGLAREAERQRFGPQDQPQEPRPRRRVLRALLADVGMVRAARLMLLGPGRRPVVKAPSTAFAPAMAPPSVAPPPASPPR